MKPILYRAKAINRNPNRTNRTDYQNGDWVYGLVSRLDEYSAEMTNTDGVSGIDVDPETICEYTGLTDKNGKRIFEDDIVKVITPHNAIGFVKIGIGEISVADYKVIGVYGEIKGERGEMVASAEGNYEIIGNIYENPELLK